jgi:hypothetical protein
MGNLAKFMGIISFYTNSRRSPYHWPKSCSTSLRVAIALVIDSVSVDNNVNADSTRC